MFSVSLTYSKDPNHNISKVFLLCCYDKIQSLKLFQCGDHLSTDEANLLCITTQFLISPRMHPHNPISDKQMKNMYLFTCQAFCMVISK